MSTPPAEKGLPSIRLWKGYHSPELLGLVREAWTSSHPLILCPPLLRDFSFLMNLPAGNISLVGDGWTAEDRVAVSRVMIQRPETIFPTLPILGPLPTLGVFTSGTVGGKPRLVLYSKANVEASLGAILEVFDRDRIDAIFAYPQPFHTFGLILGYVQAIATGRPLIAPVGRYTSDFHRQWREAARNHPGLLTLGTPTHFLDLLKTSTEWGAHDIRPTYTAIIGGASVPRALWCALRDRLRVAAPSIGYGCTEASPGLTHLPPGREPVEDGEIGGVLPGISLEILPGIGLEFSGAATCLAILQNGRIEFPRKILIRDRLVKRSENRFVFEGRHDLVFNRGGVKFSLEEIEKHLKETFPTSDFLCVAVSDERLGEDLGVLFRAPEEERESFREAIRGALHVKFLAHFSPSRILGVADLPTNAAAKADRGTGSRLLAARSTEALLE